MEPSSIYHSNKRNLVIFSGLLILVTLGSVEIVKSDETLPFVIKNPAIVQHVIFAATLYCLYQFTLSWFYQLDEIRAKFGFDFGITVAISLMAMLPYILALIRALLTNVHWPNLYALWIWISILATVSAMASSLFFYTESRRRSKTTYEIRRETLFERLVMPGWILIFNPTYKSQKRISFIADGTIGEGRNENESSWTLRDETLSIFRMTGELQNRFSYDEKTDRFLCTDDPKAKGIKGQIIFREDRP